jgi:predicted transcriptional regulator
MTVAEFISTDIFPLKKTDTCEMALVFMHDWRTFNLPVADGGKLLGYVNFEDITEAKPKEKVEKYITPLISLHTQKSSHVFEVIRLFAETRYTCVAVCDQEQNYEGAVSWNEIANVYKSSSLVQPGAILTLTMSPQDYSLSELARIIEYNDCKILHVFIYPDSSNLGKISVSLKLNKQQIGAVVHTLERYQYNIQSIHDINELNADLNSRYDWLIKYLNT